MKYARQVKKLNKWEADAQRRKQIEHAQAGKGLYRYRNRIKGTLMLPKALDNGRTFVYENEEFDGDDYFMSLVRQGMALHVCTIKSPNEVEEMQLEQKLILDQPNTVTMKGVVEQVVIDPVQAAKAAVAPKKKEKLVETPVQDEVLLTEDPLEGVVILG